MLLPDKVPAPSAGGAGMFLCLRPAAEHFRIPRVIYFNSYDFVRKLRAETRLFDVLSINALGRTYLNRKFIIVFVFLQYFLYQIATI